MLNSMKLAIKSSQKILSGSGTIDQFFIIARPHAGKTATDCTVNIQTRPVVTNDGKSYFEAIK